MIGLVTFRFDWYVVWWGSKSTHYIDTCLKEIVGLHLQMQSYPFNMIHLRNEKTVVLVRCHIFNNDKLDLFVIIMRYFVIRGTHIRYFSTYTKWFSFSFFKCLYKYANFCHELFVDLKKESIVYWCCHFKLATCILLSFYNMACNFMTSSRVKSNGLAIENVADKWTWCWEPANFTISAGPSST